MNIIKERTEVAKAINFGKYPVVFVEDIAACRNEYGWNLGKVKIASGRGYFIHADLYIFKDAMKLVTMSYGACLTDRFGWTDVEEMAQNANAPELKPNEKFVLVVGKKGMMQKAGFVLLIDAGATQIHTSEPIVIREDMKRVLFMLSEIDKL